MAQIDPTDERHVALWCGSMPNHHQLLVVATRSSSSSVEQNVPAVFTYFTCKVCIRSFALAEPTRLRAPQKTEHLNPAPRRRDQRLADLSSGTI